MDSKLQEVINQSTYEVMPGNYVYTKVVTAPSLENHFLVTKDKDEVTVVTLEENLPTLDAIERNKELYSLICLNVSVPFYAVGFLAAVSSAIAKQGLNILIVSTYSKDYILVKSEFFEKAKTALTNLGLKQA